MNLDVATSEENSVNDVKTSGAAKDTMAFPLSLARTGEQLRISAFLTGKGLGKRLSDLGLHEGSVVEVVHRERKGASIVMHANNRIALGASIAQMINVTLHTSDRNSACDVCEIPIDRLAGKLEQE